MQKLTSKFSYIFIVVFLSVLLIKCSSPTSVSDNENTRQPVLVYAKGDVYKDEWKVVDSLEQNGLTKSALVEVENIAKKAAAENNHEQIIKTLIVKAKLQSYVEENAFVNTLNELDSVAKVAEYPLNPMLHSIIGELYWMYYQNNRWKFYNRSATTNFENNDIATWDLKKITTETIKHYQLSIKNIDSLKRTPIETFNEIIIEKNARSYRPFLYDFLAHRTTDFFMSEEPSITKPVYEFALDDSSYIMPFPTFSKLKISSKDSLSLKYYALQTLQNLTNIHINDTNLSALIDIELKRLKFVKSNAAFDNADTLYYDALAKLYLRFPEDTSTAEVVYEMAKVYQARGNAFNPNEPEKYKWDLQTAMNMCKNAIKKYPNTYGADLCKQLENELNKKSLNVKTETANIPNEPLKALISYKNLDSVFHKLVKVDYDDFKKWNVNNDSDKRLEKLLASKLIKEWKTALVNDGDYREHSGEIKIDALDKGFYVLLTATTGAFHFDKEAVALSSFWVSNISYLTRRNTNEAMEFFVMDRNSGKPLQGVSAKLYYQKYNYTFRNYEWKSLGTKTTDANGYFKVDGSKDYRNFYVDFSKGDDRLNTEDSYYQYNYYEDNKTLTSTIFFTDRAIYRPGQTVYFKGIVLETDANKNNKIKTNFKSTVTFYDVNNQKVADLKLTTNEYGTFSGSFVAPNNGLNGQMYIADSYGSKYISVEEYKRPKFEVKFEPIKGTYKLEENVNVVGNAKTYSGAALDEATVTYRVVRNASFPYWCYYRWGYWPQSAEMEITNGTTTTDDNGEFTIDFIAKADKSVNKKYSPTYSYTIYADVTDINGETHSSTTYARVGYKALNINIGVNDKLNKNDVDTINFTTTNLNGEFEAATGNVKIWALKMPAKIYKKRYWSKGDVHLMSKNEFEQHFPMDEFEEENNVYKWEKNIKVYDHDFNTANKKSLRLFKLPEWSSGWYVIEAITKDKFGQEVKEIKYFNVFGEQEKHPSTNDIAWFTPLKINGEPGENATFLIATAAKNVEILYEIEHKGKIVEQKRIQLSVAQQKISIPILEKYRGNFHVHFMLVKHNRHFNFTSTVTVPHTNKQLDIEFETFRNKLLPGQKEEWKLKIKGKKGEKVAAEMVAALYDASLDAFRPNYWGLNVHHYDYSQRYWQNNNGFSDKNAQLLAKDWNPYLYNQKAIYYDQLNWFGFRYSRYNYENYMSVNRSGGDYLDDGIELEEVTYYKEPLISKDAPKGKSSQKKYRVSSGMVSKDEDKNMDVTTVTQTLGLIGDEKLAEQKQDDSGGLDEVKARINFNETAFFYPHLETNDKGEIIIKFTIPEALTKWKFMGLAHTKDLKTGMIYEETVTQKDLMVYPNAPRFFRENDKMTFSTKITNLSEKDLEGEAKIFFYDALTMKPISDKLLTSKETNTFTAKKGKSTSVNWQIAIPEGFGAITYKVIAKSGNFTDGEEMAIPVLTNRMLVTESLPLPVRGNGTTNFKFNKLLASGSSSTMKNHRLTLEFTSNPAWYAIQALPYLMEYPYECAEQTFSRFYANSIATHIANSNPKIKNVFESWKNSSPEAFLSNLEKNQELKALLLEETPWVLNAQNEGERKKRVGLLFDLNRMSNELGRAEMKLQQLQVSNGGWTWFKGMPESRYITQHIVTGMGHLDHLGVKNIREDYKTWNMVKKAVLYLDNRIREDYEWLLKHKADMTRDQLNYEIIQYLYARSYFLSDVEISSNNKEAYDFYMKQANDFWFTKSRYMQGMIALALHRNGKPKADFNTEQNILLSLKENAIQHDELGMYWKDNLSGYYWYQAPIEVQALLIEAFDEIANDTESVEAMKIWLLKQKQTQDWRTTKATTEACYALLLRGTDLLASDELVEIKVGNTIIDPKKMDDVKVEAGTGYFKTSWSKTEIKPEMGNITVTKKDEGVAWGAMYWQYFEQLDKITTHETPLKLSKKLFVQRNTDAGTVIELIKEGTTLKPGDKIKVRIELRVDRNMEYVHMKDMRAAGFEPINVFSGYRYQDGLGYYESTKDAATNFFFDYLPKGTYVFEYPLRVNMSGDFSNGITSIQCMYAPEFTSHSEGIRVLVAQ
ncbi:MAG: alpha-2-macroglobulin family protein [Vicingaceae bacterium]|nr:alpha-2-macroglobulin family protein [Vicingaceae bacterium]